MILFSCARIKIQQQKLNFAPASNWEMGAGNPERTNLYPGAIELPLRLKWHLSATANIDKAILVSDGMILFTTMDGKIFAYFIDNNKKIGHIKTDHSATIALRDSTLFIAQRYGEETLFSYDLKRGKINWKINAGDIFSEPLILDSGIVVSALYNHIDYYHLPNGESIWQFKTKKQIRSSPASDGERIIFGCDDGFLYALQKKNGKLLWEFNVDGSVQATPVISENFVYVGSTNHLFCAINLLTGKLEWEFSANGQILNAAAVADSIVVFGSTDAFLYCLNRFTGKLLWTFQAKSVIGTSPLICGDKIFVGSLDHHLYALDKSSGVELWKFDAKGRIHSAPVVWGNYLILAAEDDKLYVFESATGK